MELSAFCVMLQMIAKAAKKVLEERPERTGAGPLQRRPKGPRPSSPAGQDRGRSTPPRSIPDWERALSEMPSSSLSSPPGHQKRWKQTATKTIQNKITPAEVEHYRKRRAQEAGGARDMQVPTAEATHRKTPIGAGGRPAAAPAKAEAPKLPTLELPKKEEPRTSTPPLLKEEPGRAAQASHGAGKEKRGSADEGQLGAGNAAPAAAKGRKGAAQKSLGRAAAQRGRKRRVLEDDDSESSWAEELASPDGAADQEEQRAGQNRRRLQTNPLLDAVQTAAADVPADGACAPAAVGVAGAKLKEVEGVEVSVSLVKGLQLRAIEEEEEYRPAAEKGRAAAAERGLQGSKSGAAGKLGRGKAAQKGRKRGSAASDDKDFVAEEKREDEHEEEEEEEQKEKEKAASEQMMRQQKVHTPLQHPHIREHSDSYRNHASASY